VAQRMSGLSREELCSNSKRRGTVAVKEAVIVGRRGGIRGLELAAALGWTHQQPQDGWRLLDRGGRTDNSLFRCNAESVLYLQ
jgi:hypothetical protein